MKKYSPGWEASNTKARLWSQGTKGSVQCHLSPRECKLREGQAGFCRVRQNIGGELVTLNYGRATQLTQERIETEAVFHYAPGAKILSLGNIGCMMSCDYCHNWKTSQAKFVENKDVKTYTPEDVVDIAEQYGIQILSWTYNDPVVWHEFVLDTAALAQKRGMKNLYKSAFFISEAGASELCDVIDIFSVSIKTLDPKIYRKVTKGWLQPVLDATKLVHARGKHLEISSLLVTDSTDTEDNARSVAEWCATELSPEVPLHFVRFHPDYKYTHVGRTPIPRLERAREIAFESGVKHCYLGNVYGHEATNTHCRSCGNLLVERFGLSTWVRGISADGRCISCGTDAHFTAMDLAETVSEEPDVLDGPPVVEPIYLAWENEVNACHVEAAPGVNGMQSVFYTRVQRDGRELGLFRARVNAAGGRFILTQASEDEVGVRVLRQEGAKLAVYRVYDRAHYPTVSIEDEAQPELGLPSPRYEREPLRVGSEPS